MRVRVDGSSRMMATILPASVRGRSRRLSPFSSSARAKSASSSSRVNWVAERTCGKRFMGCPPPTDYARYEEKKSEAVRLRLRGYFLDALAISISLGDAEQSFRIPDPGFDSLYLNDTFCPGICGHRLFPPTHENLRDRMETGIFLIKFRLDRFNGTFLHGCDLARSIDRSLCLSFFRPCCFVRSCSRGDRWLK